MFKGLSLFSRCAIMGKEDRLTGIRNGDDDDACSRNTTMNCDKDDDDDACSGKTTMNGGAGAWSDLTHDVVFLVMMQLGVIDFVAFSGVCKSWRSVALSYMNTFMASRPPMFMSPDDADDVEWYCYLKDVEGRRFKTIVPHSAEALCVGITCGYVILYATKTRDFWLVNPITRHELHFPNAPRNVIIHALQRKIKAILVFSPPISGCWVLVVLNINTHEIWFSKGELGAWDHVSSIVPIEDLHFFKGKIYTLHHSTDPRFETNIIGVMSLDPKLTLFETKNFPSSISRVFLCSAEHLYLVEKPLSYFWDPKFPPHKLDFDEMKWVVADENTHAFFLSYDSNYCGVVKPESWWQAQFRISTSDDLCGNDTIFDSDHMWYFPHEFRNINRMDH